MTRHLRPLFITTLALLVVTAPALAQYANEYVPPKLQKLGTTSKPIAGSGIVEVKVRVNADGSHTLQSIIKATNKGDVEAASEIVATSTYSPGRRGTHPITAFVTFSLKFVGKSFVGEAISSNIDVQRTETMIRAGKYEGAKTRATSFLLEHPGDAAMLQELGAAEFFLNHATEAAAAFAKVPVLAQEMKGVAAHAFAAGAVKLAETDAPTAVIYGQRAVALDPGANGTFALGVAQEANKQYAEAAVTLEKARTLAMADPKTDKASKVNLDARLMGVYAELGDDAKAQNMALDIKRLDPSSTLPSQFLGSRYIKLGQAAMTAKNVPEAIKEFDKAVALGNTKISVVALASSAFAYLSGEKPDFDKAKAYADKAIALNPSDAASNYAQGIALFGQSVSFHRDDLKDQAKVALKKAEALATASNDEALLLQIQNFEKNNIH